MFNKHDIDRDACQLFGAQAHQIISPAHRALKKSVT